MNDRKIMNFAVTCGDGNPPGNRGLNGMDGISGSSGVDGEKGKINYLPI
jgi:hypothetical protein